MIVVFARSIPVSAVHYVIWRDCFAQIELGMEIANVVVD